jgi:hypothetical protein
MLSNPSKIQTRLWSTESKVWDIVPKASRHRGCDSVSNSPCGAPGSTPLYVHLPPAWGSAGCDRLISRFLWTNMGHKYEQRKICEGFSWIQISSLRYTFLWNQSTMVRFRYVRYCVLLKVRNYWRNKANWDAQQIRQWSRCMGRLVRPPQSY